MVHARPQGDLLQLGDRLQDVEAVERVALDEVVILENSSKESALPLAEFGQGRALASPVRGEKHYSRYLKKNLVMPEAAVAAGVTEDLTTKVSAVDLVRSAVIELGGKGGGGRPDMAQGGGPSAEKAESAITAAKGILEG